MSDRTAESEPACGRLVDSSAAEVAQFFGVLFDGVDGYLDVRLIDAEGNTQRHTFETIDEAIDFIATVGAVNVYAGISTRRTGGTEKDEGGKANLAAVRAVWVDIDFAGPDDAALVAELLERFPHPPSLIVSTGGGIHLYWFLDEPYDVTTSERIQALEDVLKGLTDCLGGDSAATHASRILRIPGTTNYPNAKKRAKGRTTQVCKIQLLEEHRRYAFDDFEAFGIRGAEYRRQKVETLAYEVETFHGECPPSVLSLLEEKGPKGNPRHSKLVARWSGDKTNPNGNASDSELDQSTANLLALNGIEPGDIENALRFRRQEFGAKKKHAGCYRLTVSKAIQAAASRLGIDHTSQPTITIAAAAVRTGDPKIVAGHPARQPTRPTIQLNGSQTRVQIAAAAQAVAARNVPPRLFVRGSNVVRISRDDVGVAYAEVVPKDAYVSVLSDAADFERYDARSKCMVICNPPKDFAASVFDELRHGEGNLPRLRSVTGTPIIKQTGELISEEGFDPESEIYFAPRVGFAIPPVPVQPTWQDVQRAIDTIQAPFAQIPFATHADKSNFLAAMVTTVIRDWFRVVPFFVIEAPSQGTGKTLLAESLRMIGAGSAGVSPAPEAGKTGDSNEEWRRKITSLLLAGNAIVTFDNVKGLLGGGALSAVATSSEWSDRLLCTNSSPTFPNRTSWIFTSNNAEVDADLLRRCFYTRVDARNPTPYLRQGFKIPDLIAYVEEHRGEILAALYTLVRYWIACGAPAAPTGTATLGSYEKWSQIIPGILGAAGIDGVMGDLEARLEMMRDPDEIEAGEFLEKWWEQPGLRIGTATRDIVAAAKSRGCSFELPSTVVGDRGREGNSTSLAKSLGRWLRARMDRIVPFGNATYAVRFAGGNDKRGWRWTVERQEARELDAYNTGE